MSGMTELRGTQSSNGHRAFDPTRVPYRVFTDAELYAREQEQLFRGPTWNYLALEAELAKPGDFRANFVGETPVFITRDAKGELHALVNRCAHRGAMVCREVRGNRKTMVCPYHQWSYDLNGNLRGVPFRRGINGKGGYPSDFNLAEHSLTPLRVATYRGLVFGSFSDSVAPLPEYLGPEMREHLDTIFNRPVTVLGFTRQLIHGNWKVYAENTKDPYHGSLLHMFHATFGSYRSSQDGGMVINGAHSKMIALRAPESQEVAAYTQESVGSFSKTLKLADPSLLAGRPEFDRFTTTIQFLFPTLIIQQISNTLATRQLVPLGVDRFELLVTYFGYQDDDPELRAMRIKQSNLIGPAGLIALEDGYAVELVQRAVAYDNRATSYVELGGRGTGDQDSLVTEAAIRAFWQAYGELMGLRGDGSADGSYRTARAD
ncbi:MAG TPA: Rieske 2Fe-2S domain-containing protein [Candidatus Binataceae bacterium]|nr:Rieske 2Fe-2S domain-containing protein [Candidatus Binataceae bacterium]